MARKGWAITRNVSFIITGILVLFVFVVFIAVATADASGGGPFGLLALLVVMMVLVVIAGIAGLIALLAAAFGAVAHSKAGPDHQTPAANMGSGDLEPDAPRSDPRTGREG